MLLTNYHTHCDFCDGAGKPEDYITEAISKGFHALGFSSHAPISFEREWTLSEKSVPDYLQTINSLKREYADRIEVYTGLEIDYLEGISGPSSKKFSTLGLDYTIGSVHMIPVRDSDSFLPIDGAVELLKELLKNTFDGSFEKLSERYFGLIRDMLKNHQFNILGHLDLLKKRNTHNLLFDENALWYRNQVLDTLDVLAETDVILEVNTGGISRKAIDSVYPSPWIISEARKRDIPLMLNADAHVPEHIDYYYSEALAIIKECRYGELYSLSGGKWITREI
ncbi:MAG: histidinol-phosphatase [Spirochaetaceae bacterium]|nr:histidinol-phosphatase [Spirochaetaceae bacterium]